MEEKINKEFNLFFEQILEMNFYAEHIIEQSLESYKTYIEEQKNLYAKNGYSHKEKIFSKRPVYFDILKNNEKTIGDPMIKKSLEELLEHATLHVNKQLQWLFVEMYELYEKFIVDLYALIGYLKPDFWDLVDFGEIQLCEIQHNLEWFKHQARRKKEVPYSIINVFDKRLNLSKHCVQNPEEPLENYDFIMGLISEFRHAIVHHKGILDEEKITKLLNKKLSNIKSKDIKNKYREFIKGFFVTSKYKNLICLTTIYEKEIIFNPRYNRLEILTMRMLLSYLNLIRGLLIENICKSEIHDS